MRKTGPTNQNLINLIKELKTVSIKNKVPLWKRIATELEKPTRKRRKVNIFHIEKNAKDGETIIIPGKVLATGELTKKVKVAALNFSEQAKNKIKDIITINELIKQNPKGKKIRIIG